MFKFNLLYEKVLSECVPYNIINNSDSHILLQFNPVMLEAVEKLALLRTTEQIVVKRARDLHITNLKVLKDGIISFKVTSGTNPRNLPYTITIQFNDWNKIFGNTKLNMTLTNKLKTVLKGTIIIDCTCKSFRYDGYAYMLTQKDAKYGQQVDIIPKKKNPKLEGSVCKHLRKVLENIDYLIPKIIEKINLDGSPKP